MATKRKYKAPTKRTSATKTSTKWLMNAMKSIGVATNGVISDIAPNTYEIATSAAQASRDIALTLSRNRNGVNRVTSTLQQNRYVKAVQKAYQNALLDIKAGNLAGDASRMAESFGGGTDFSDLAEGFSFGDDGAERDVNINYFGGGDNGAVLNMQNSFNTYAENSIKMQQASTNAFIAVSAASMGQIGQLGSDILGELGNINNSLTALVQYQNDTMSKYIEAHMAWMEKTGPNLSGEDDKKDDARKALFSGGKFNMSAYKNVVKKQFKEALSNTDIGLLADMLDDDTLDMLSSNPLGFLSEGIARVVIPKALTSTLSVVEKGFDNVMPMFMDRMAELGKKEGATLMDSFLRVVGQSLGVDLSDKRSMKSSIKTDALPFDGETKGAITEVIPHELRTQTAYLKVIAEKMVGKRQLNRRFKNAVDQQEFLDFESGTYIKRKDIDSKISDQLMTAIRSGFETTDFGKSMGNLISAQRNPKAQEQMRQFIDDLYVQISKSGNADLGLDLMLKLVNNTGATPSAKKKIREYISQMANSSRSSFDSISRGRMGSVMNLDAAIDEIEANQSKYNLINSSFNQRLGKDGEPIDIRDTLRETAGMTKKSRNIRMRSARPGDYRDYETSDAPSNVIAAMDNLTGTLNASLKRLIAGDVTGAFGGLVTGIGNTDAIKNKKAKIKSKFEEMVGQVKVGFMATMFGKDAAIEFATKDLNDEDKEEAIRAMQDSGLISSEKGFAGIVGKVTSYFGEGFHKWGNALFGTDEEIDQTKKDFINQTKKSLGAMGIGAVGGVALNALAGSSILGAMIGGPLGGAVLGAAGGFLAKNERFQKWLFGDDIDPDDPTKGKTGGIISRATQDFFKENKGVLGVGAGIGAIAGAKFGGGLLGTLVGGPVAGALFGLAGGIAASKGVFNTFLFGDEKTGQKSFFQGISDAFKAHARLGEGDEVSSMGAAGATVGALTGAMLMKMGVLGGALGPAGVIGGALLGLSAGIRAEGKTFKEFLWGEKDGVEVNGNKYDKVGIFDKIANSVATNFIMPLRDTAENFFDDMFDTIKYDVLAPISYIGESIAEKVGDMVGFMRDRAIDVFAPVAKTIADGAKALFEPVLRTAAGAIDKVVDIAGKTVSMPFKIVSAVLTKPLKKVTDILGTAAKGVASAMWKVADAVTFIPREVGKAFILGGVNLFKGIFKGIGGAAKGVGGFANNMLGKLLFRGKDMSFTEGAKDFLETRGITKALKAMWTSGDDKDSRFKRMRGERALAKEARKKQKLDRKNSTYNAQLINRLSGGQFTEDSEDARAFIRSLFGDDEEGEKAYKEQFEDKLKKTNFSEALAKKKAEVGESVVRKALEINGKRDPFLSEMGQMVQGIWNVFKILSGKNPDTGKDDKKEERRNQRRFILDRVKDGSLTQKEAVELSRKLGLGHADASELISSQDTTDTSSQNVGGGHGPRGGRGLLSSLLGGVLGLLGGNTGGQHVARVRGSAAHQQALSPKLASDIGIINQRVNSEAAAAEAAGDNARASIASGNNTANDRLNSSNDKEGVIAALQREAANKARLADAQKNAIDAKELKQQKELDKERYNGIKEGLNEISENIQDQAAQWGSIFGSKGIMTIAALTLFGKFPQLASAITSTAATLINGVWPKIKEIGGDVLDLAVKFGKEASEDRARRTELDANTGGRSSWDEVQYQAGQLAGGNIFMDDQGRVLNNGSKYGKMMAHAAWDVGIASGVKGFAGTKFNRIGQAVGKIGRGVGSIGERVLFGKNTSAKMTSKGKDLMEMYKAGKISRDELVKLGTAYGDDAVEAAVHKKGLVDVAKKAATKANDVINAAAKSDNKILSKLGDAMTKVAKFISEKLGPKFAGAAKFATQFADNVIGALSKKWASICTDISKAVAEKLSLNVSAATVSFGLSELGFAVIGGLSGGTKNATAKLFYVDESKVDGTMRFISGILGAIAGTTFGGLADIAISFAGMIMNTDYLSVLACAIYKFIKEKTGDEIAAANLDAARKDQAAEYAKYQEQEIKKAYEEALASGTLNSNVSLEEFTIGVHDGSYQVNYQSMTDWNADQHKGMIATAVGKVKGFFNSNKSQGSSASMPTSTAATSIPSSTMADPYAAATMYTGQGGGRGPRDILRRSVTNAARNVNVGAAAVSGLTKVNPKSAVHYTGQVASFNVDGSLVSPNATMIKQLGGIGILMGDATTLLGRMYRELVGIAEASANTTGHIKKATLSNLRNSGSISTLIRSGVTKAIANMPKEQQQAEPVPTEEQAGGGAGDSLNGATYYNQNDSRWGNLGYGSYIDGATMGDSGCGPTAFAAAASDALGTTITPPDMASLALATGNRDTTGTNWNFINDASSAMGLNSVQAFNPSAEYLRSQIASGNPVVLSGASGGYGRRRRRGGRGTTPYTPEGHYVYAVGMNRNGDVIVNDPLGGSGVYNAGALASQTGSMWTLGGYGRRRRGGRGPESPTEDQILNAERAYADANRGSSNFSIGGFLSGLLGGPDKATTVEIENTSDPTMVSDPFATASAIKPSSGNATTKQQSTASASTASDGKINGKTIDEWLKNPRQIWKKDKGMYVNQITGNIVAEIPKEIWVNKGTNHGGITNWYNTYTGESAYSPNEPYQWVERSGNNGSAYWYNVYTGETVYRKPKNGTIISGAKYDAIKGNTAGLKEEVDDYARWLGVCKAVKEAIAAQSPGYSQQRSISITVGGRTEKVRTDCSGYVSGCLKFFGVMNATLSSSMIADPNDRHMTQTGFTYKQFTGWENLTPGDIIARNGHTEIFMENKDGKHYVYNCGDNASCNNPGFNQDTKTNYTAVWSPGKAGESCVDGVADTSISGDAASGESYGAALNTGTDAAGNEIEENPFTKLLSYLGNAFAAVGTRALNGTLGSNMDYSYNTIMGITSDDESGTSAGTSGSSSAASSMKRPPGISDEAWAKLQEQSVSSNSSTGSGLKVAGNSTKDKIWNALRTNFGLNAIGAAGVMGSWEPESGNDPSRMEGDYAFLKNASEEYRDKILSDDATGNEYMQKLFASYRKNGMSVDESFYTWPSYANNGRYKPGIGLYGFTGSRAMGLHKTYGDGWNKIENQLEYALNGTGEFNDHDKQFGLRDKLNNAASPEDASDVSFDLYKNSKSGYHNTNIGWLKKNVNNGRSAARSYYNMYKDVEPVQASTGSSGSSTMKRPPGISDEAWAKLQGGGNGRGHAVLVGRRGGRGMRGGRGPVTSPNAYNGGTRTLPSLSSTERKYITTSNNSSTEELMLNALTILAAIAENTGASSSKLDMLSHLKQTSNITVNQSSGGLGGRGSIPGGSRKEVPSNIIYANNAHNLQGLSPGISRADRKARQIAAGGNY